MRTIPLLVTLMVVAACQRAETPDQAAARIESESQIARGQIEPIIADWERWFAAGQVDSLASILAEDVKILPPNQPAIIGRANWIAWVRPSFAQGDWTEDIIMESLVANGPMAVERGRYLLNLTPGPNAPRGTAAISDTGKYLWHWRRVDDRWRLAQAIWNSDLPVP